MNEIFNFKGQEVRTVTIDNEPYFVGKDVASVLGYTNSRQALKSHVDEDDKGVSNFDTPGGKQDRFPRDAVRDFLRYHWKEIA